MSGHKKRKGFIMIYTVIVLLLCACTIFYMFSYAVSERSSINDYKGCFENSKIDEGDKEYLFDTLNKKIYKNIYDVKNQNVKAYLQKLNNDFRIYHGNSYLMYCRENDRIKLVSYLSNGKIYESVFQYQIYDRKISYTLIN